VAEQWRSTLKAEVRFLSPAPFPVKERLVSHEALGRLAGAANITTILLAILGLVLVTTIVLSATEPLGALHWKWMLLAAGSCLLLLSWIVVIGYRRRRTRR
jgi:hypothetical protein